MLTTLTVFLIYCVLSTVFAVFLNLGTMERMLGRLHKPLLTAVVETLLAAVRTFAVALISALLARVLFHPTGETTAIVFWSVMFTAALLNAARCLPEVGVEWREGLATAPILLATAYLGVTLGLKLHLA